MNELPEFWRAAVYHPLTVHFPIALLLTATVFKAIALVVQKEVWQSGGSYLLYAGTIGAWVAIYTGDLADGAVSRTLCDPTVLKAHENGAYVMAWLFTAAAIVDLTFLLGLVKWKLKMLHALVLLIMLTGSGYLVYVGDLGAKLVYQQGAGVYHPGEDCGEFE